VRFTFPFLAHSPFDLRIVGPAGALPDVQYLGKLMGRDTSLGGIYQEDHIKGFGNRDPGILKNGEGDSRFIVTAFRAPATQGAAPGTIMVMTTPPAGIVVAPFHVGQELQAFHIVGVLRAEFLEVHFL